MNDILIYCSTPLLIALYILLIGAAVCLTVKQELPDDAWTMAPALGIMCIVAVSAVMVPLKLAMVFHRFLALFFAAASLFVCIRSREAFRALFLPRSVVRLLTLFVAVIILSCALTSFSGAVPFTEPASGSWRSFAPFYPSDGLIPFDSAALIANRLPSSQFVFEPGWSVTDRTHMLTLLYLHFCGVLSITPEHYPNRPWSLLDGSGFWLLRAVAFAANGFVLFGIWGLGSVLLSRQAALAAAALACLAVFTILNVSYTWPKMLAAYLVLVATRAILTSNWKLAGLMFGLAYWSHPFSMLFLIPAAGFVLTRRSLRAAAGFVLAVGLTMGASSLFLGTFSASTKQSRFWYYPLQIGYYFGHKTPDQIWQQLGSVSLFDLAAVRSHNLMRLIFPAEMTYVNPKTEPPGIHAAVGANWLRTYESSLWGATGLVLFVAAVAGMVQSWSRRECRTVVYLLGILPSLGYLALIGFLDYGGARSFAQPVTAMSHVFGASALMRARRTTILMITGAASVELVASYLAMYRSGIVTLGVGLFALFCLRIVLCESESLSSEMLPNPIREAKLPARAARSPKSRRK